MANLSCISKHCVTLRTVVVTEGNVIQPCIDPVESPTEKNAEWKHTFGCLSTKCDNSVGSISPLYRVQSQ